VLKSAQIVTCKLPAGEQHPHPLPGSLEAALDGCMCPAEQPAGSVSYATDCPVHELMKVPS
jgi:hypothetical protein